MGFLMGFQPLNTIPHQPLNVSKKTHEIRRFAARIQALDEWGVFLIQAREAIRWDVWCCLYNKN